MCNKLHMETFESFAEKGTAWKLFHENKQFICRNNSYDYGKDGWIIWKREYHKDGFCMFTTFDEAKQALNMWQSNPVILNSTKYENIKQVQYRKGLGTCLEKEFTSKPVRILIAKEFKIVEENINAV